MGRLIVRLKAIKYKVDIIRYLSSYLSGLDIELSYQVACFESLTFSSLVLRFSAKYICLSFFGSWIRKAIREDSDPNRIKLRKIKSQ